MGSKGQFRIIFFLTIFAINRAKELRELNVNMNFSPVLDYVSNNKSYLYSRTFGTNQNAVGKLGSAIGAGADIIISTYTPEKQIRIFNSLKNSVLNGDITEERINESVVRILNLKTAFGFSP